MILSLLFQTFLFAAFQGQSPDLGLQPITPVSAAVASAEMELIQGYDEYTALSFAHSLPVVGEDDFGPQRLDGDSLGILTTAESALVIDRRTKKILFDKSGDDVRPIASITKLVTALTLLDLGLNMQDIVTISPYDKKDGGRIYVYTGEEFSVQDLWFAGLLASDNVAITALVRHIGLSTEEFAVKMNEKAQTLEMVNSRFNEPTGISRHNVSTAREIALLLDEAFHHSELADALRRSSYTFRPLNKDSFRTVYNTNKLVDSYLNEDPFKLLGGKTGFTFEAGYCLGVVVDGAELNDQLIVIVLGADSIDARFQEVKGLIDWTYEQFQW